MKTKETQHTPTAAAFRAMVALGSCAWRLHTHREIAEIIDRETGLPELLEACERAREWMAKVLADPSDIRLDGTLTFLDDALAKARGQ